MTSFMPSLPSEQEYRNHMGAVTLMFNYKYPQGFLRTFLKFTDLWV